jgi:hypothetical protein
MKYLLWSYISHTDRNISIHFLAPISEIIKMRNVIQNLTSHTLKQQTARNSSIWPTERLEHNLCGNLKIQSLNSDPIRSETRHIDRAHQEMLVPFRFILGRGSLTIGSRSSSNIVAVNLPVSETEWHKTKLGLLRRSRISYCCWKGGDKFISEKHTTRLIVIDWIGVENYYTTWSITLLHYNVLNLPNLILFIDTFNIPHRTRSAPLYGI